MNAEIVAGPAPATGVMVASLAPVPWARRILGVSVTSTSAAATVAAVFVDSLFGGYLDATAAGNGDSGGAAGITLPPNSALLVRWSAAAAGAEGRAVVSWEPA